MNDYEGNPIMDVFDDPSYRDSLIREMAEQPLYDPIEDLPTELNDF